jgi:hypothetical protein
MKQSPYTEADGRSAIWEILFLEPKIYYVHKKARLTPQMELPSTPVVKWISHHNLVKIYSCAHLCFIEFVNVKVGQFDVVGAEWLLL